MTSLTTVTGGTLLTGVRATAMDVTGVRWAEETQRLARLCVRKLAGLEALKKALVRRAFFGRVVR